VDLSHQPFIDFFSRVRVLESWSAENDNGTWSKGAMSDLSKRSQAENREADGSNEQFAFHGASG
jgi:hypothetical protein